MKKLTPQDLIKQLDLKPLPSEGGLFTRTYLADEQIPVCGLPQRYPAQERAFGSAILYLLTSDPDSFSALHRLPTDEIYHFYLGDPLLLLNLHPDGSSEKIILGQDILNGQKVQYVSPRGVWQGSCLLQGGQFALIGTTLAPAFAEQDYEGADRENLIRQYPLEADLIRRLTRINSGSKMEKTY